MIAETTEHKDRFIGLIEKIVATLMLGGAIVFLYRILMPMLDHGLLAAGDDTIHFSYTMETLRSLKHTGKLLDWTYMYGLGEPIYVFRPPGFYYAPSIIYLLSFGSLPFAVAHKLAYMLPICLYPVAIFYMLHKFKFPPLVCGIASLLAFAPISTFGHAMDAYYNLGLAKQVYAIFFFPFAVGKLHGIIANRERIMPGAILFGLTFLNHPYIGWAFCLVAGLYMVIECLTQPDWRWCLKVVSKTALVLVAGLASVSFWLLPLYSNPESQLTEDFSGQRRHAFDVAVDTAQGVGDHYLQGSLFDQSVPGKTGVFGGKSGWAWKRNEQVKRWPVLSWGSLVGAAALLLGWRRRRNVFLVTVWVMSMLVLLGPDDVRQLTWIPFQSQVQYIHWIPVPELMVICLTAYGLYAVAALIWWVIDACLLRFISLGALQRAVLYVMLVSLCAAPFVHNVLNERFKYCFGKYRNRRFEVTEEGQTQWSLQYGNNKALQKCSDYLRNELSRFERFHGSPVIISGGTGILHLTMLPAYTERTNIISPLFGGIVGGVNRIVHKGPFRFHFWKSAIALDMMRVGAVLYPRRGKDRYPYDANVFSEQKQFGEWTVYKAAPSGPCGTTAQRPILVVGNPRMWEEACMAWFRTVQTLQKKEDVDRLPFLAWQWHPRKGKKSEMSLDQFSAICIPDPLLDADDFFHEDELSRFIDAGGTVFTVVKKGDLMPAWATYGIKRLRNLPLSSIGTDADSSAVIETVEERAGYHAVDVTAEKECFLYLKVAFHRGWRIDVDGVRVPNISLSPGFNACRLSPGKHHVAYTYTGRNRGKLGNFISLATLIGLSVTPVTGLVRRIRKRKKNGTEKERAETDQSQDGME